METAEKIKTGPEYSLKAKYITSFFVSLFFSLIIALIVYAVAYVFDKASLAAIQNGKTNVADIGFARPESRETYSYIVFFLFFIISFILCCILLNKKLTKLFVLTDKFLNNGKAATTVCFAGIFISLGLLSIYLFGFFGLIWPGLVGILLILLYLLISKKKSIFCRISLFAAKHKKALKAAAFILCGLLLIFVLFFYFCTNNFLSPGHFHHFSAYYYSVYDVYNGGTLLIDTNSIYGFYAYLLMPYFKLVGLSFVSFTILILILIAVILLCVFYILTTLTKNYIYVLLGFFAFIGYMFFYGMGHDGFLYLQYLPHRVLAPVVMLAYMCRTIKKDRLKPINIIIGYALCSFFLIWNMETGMISLLAYCVFLVYKKANNYNKICKSLIIHTIKYIAFSVLAFIFSAAFIILITLIKSGSFINIFSIFGLVGQGCFMLPLPKWPHLYMVVLLVYAAALSASVFQLKLISQKEAKNPNVPILFVISVIGVLSFIYYLGRSHDYNLTPCTWACIFLCVYFLDYAHKQISLKTTGEFCNKTKDLAQGQNQNEAPDGQNDIGVHKNYNKQKPKDCKRLLLPGLQIVLICVMITIAVFPIAYPAQNQLTQNYISKKTAVSPDFDQNKKFIESYFADKDSLYLISENSALYLTDLKKTQKFKYKSTCDWFTLQDYENALLLIDAINEDFIITYATLLSLEKYAREKYAIVFKKFAFKNQSGNELENLMLFSPAN